MFKYSCLHFPPYDSTPPHPLPTSHPQSFPLWLRPWLCLWVLYTCSLMTLPLLSPIISSPLPSGYCQFFISMSLVLFCSLVCFVDWVPLIGEIIWYLSFTTCLVPIVLFPQMRNFTMKNKRFCFLKDLTYCIIKWIHYHFNLMALFPKDSFQNWFFKCINMQRKWNLLLKNTYTYFK